MYLTNIKPIEFNTHHAGVGMNGELGYSLLNDSIIRVNNNIYPYGIGAHAPSVVKFKLNGEYETLITEVGINQSAEGKYLGTCDFYIYADEKLVGVAPRVIYGETPKIHCNLNKCKTLTLVNQTSTPMHCHSVWLNPKLYTSRNKWNISCYGTHKYENINIEPSTKYCFISVINDKYIKYFTNLYRTLKHYLSLKDYTYVVYGIDLSEDSMEKLQSLHVRVINASPICDTTQLSSKFLALETYKIIDSEYYIFMDADMLITDDISDLLLFLPSYSQNQISICRQTDVGPYHTFMDALSDRTNDSYRDYDLTIQNIRIQSNVLSFTHTLNSGFYIAGREALCKANNLINKLLPEAFEWEREKLSECWWREEAILTICISQMNNCNILPCTYNVQLQTKEVEFKNGGFYYNNEKCKILHMVGRARDEKYDKIWEELKEHHGW